MHDASPERLPARDLELVLETAESSFRALSGGRLFLTGGSGFFGRWLLESLTHAADRLGLAVEVVALTRSPAAFAARLPHLAAHRAVALHAGDMATFTPPSGSFPFVVHAATEPVLGPADPGPVELFERNLAGTRRVLEIAAGAGVKRLLFTSSGAAYGTQPPEVARVDEEAALSPSTTDPATAYGQAKRASEFLACAAARQHGFDAVIARCFAFVGPGLPLASNFAIGNFIADALAGGPIRVAGDGTPRRSYLYAADLSAWLWRLLAAGTGQRIYNVGSEQDLSIEELARTVAAAVAPRAPVIVAGTPVAGRPASRYVPSTRRAREELGLAEWTALPDAIRRTAAWARAGAASRAG